MLIDALQVQVPVWSNDPDLEGKTHLRAGASVVHFCHRIKCQSTRAFLTFTCLPKGDLLGLKACRIGYLRNEPQLCLVNQPLAVL